MTADELETVRVGAAAFELGNLEAALENLDPEAEFTLPAEMTPEGRTYRGVAGARAAIRQMIGGFDAYNARIESFVDAGDGSIVVLGVHGGYDRALARQVKLSPGAIITPRDGRAIRVEIFATWAEALRAAGVDPTTASETPVPAFARREHPQGDGVDIWPDGA